MSHFITPLDLRRIEDVSRDSRGTWRLLAVLVYWSSMLKMQLAVPAGFITDLASVPRLPFAYLLAGGIGHAAAVLHDWLYSCHAVDRKTADNLFYEALVALGISRWRAYLMWIGVRAGGWASWDAEGSKQLPHVEAEIEALHPDGP